MTRHDDSQVRVIECQDKVIVAEAFAGAGKTTTAIGYAAARPKAKMLYLCLNKANQMEASTRFGQNVECRTSHSVAYAAIGHKFKDQLTVNLKPRTFADELRISDSRQAAVVLSVLNQFFSSKSPCIEEVHTIAAQEQFALEPSNITNAIALARLAWGRMQTPGSGLSITHDAYLKMWALTRPKLDKYTHIILDEAQDTNPVTAGVIEQQNHATRLLIGDRHQSIYLFRGSVNAMEEFAGLGATVLKMPKTWRFGSEIAGYANDLLSFFKMETTPIVGAGPSCVRQVHGARAVLSRTNVGLFGEAVAVMGRYTHWVGGIEAARLGLLQSAYNLYCGQTSIVTDPQMSAYRSWSEYKTDAENSRDMESRMLIKLVEEYKHDLPRITQALRSNALPTQDGARLVLSTAHKAKGLDWDRVQLGQDFSSIENCLSARLTTPQQRMSPELEQEINLLYVAITRARHDINLDDGTADFIKKFPIHVNALMESSAQTEHMHQLTQQAVPAAC